MYLSPNYSTSPAVRQTWRMCIRRVRTDQARGGEPALNCRRIKGARRHRCFLRTYSARIYFIETNSSLACLHVPHPSNPVDDIRALPSYREHGLFQGSRGRLATFLHLPYGWSWVVRQRVERQSDGLSLCSSLLVKYIMMIPPTMLSAFVVHSTLSRCGSARLSEVVAAHTLTYDPRIGAGYSGTNYHNIYPRGQQFVVRRVPGY